MKPDSRIGWLIPALIVAVNAVAVLASWGSLPETLPAHFDLQGNAGGAMSRGTMPVFMLAEPVILLLSLAGFVICLVKAKAQTE